ncbi:hypothetical protein GGF41_000396 [Coemansia sp. RSA 2531]|nr:hypothetical protein GGF41_000396 [Coemansia sp. RSA 2531]
MSKKNVQENKKATLAGSGDAVVEVVKPFEEGVIEDISKSLSRMMISSSAKLSEALCEEYNLDADKVNEISKRVLASFIGDVDGMVVNKKAVKQTKVEREVADDEMCKFTLLRGDRKGEMCGKRSTKGFDFCSIHKASMIKKGELVGKVEGVKNKGLEFIPHEEDSGTYTVKGTKLVVVRLDLQKDMDIDNCEVVGHLSDGKVMALDGTNKKIADINGLKVGTDFMVVDDKTSDVTAK